MRFAWLRKQAANGQPVKQGGPMPLGLIRFAYNLVFWVFLLPFVTSIDFSAGFVAFSIVVLIRLIANLYANNLLEPDPVLYARFPFRS